MELMQMPKQRTLGRVQDGRSPLGLARVSYLLALLLLAGCATSGPALPTPAPQPTLPPPAFVYEPADRALPQLVAAERAAAGVKDPRSCPNSGRRLRASWTAAALPIRATTWSGRGGLRCWIGTSWPSFPIRRRPLPPRQLLRRRSPAKRQLPRWGRISGVLCSRKGVGGWQSCGIDVGAHLSRTLQIQRSSECIITTSFVVRDCLNSRHQGAKTRRSAKKGMKHQALRGALRLRFFGV